MKRTLIALPLIAATLALSGCNNDKTINGKNYETFGIINEDDRRDPNIKYEISFGSVVCAIIFSETVIVPVFVVGWDLWQPVRAK